MTTLRLDFRTPSADSSGAAQHANRQRPPRTTAHPGQNGAASLCAFARATADHLAAMGRERLAETYTASVNSFMRFRGSRGDVSFDEMDSRMMADYEAFLRQRGLAANTTSFYMRTLRAIYNRAVESGLATSNAPFRRVYTGIGKTAKRAVPPEVIRRIKALDLPPQSPLGRARDLFMFSLYTRGMSFIDMAYLAKADLNGGILAYRRQKTGQLLSVKWEKPMQDIIDRHPTPGSPYLLPIIAATGGGRRRQYLNAIHIVNSNLKVIGRLVHSPVRLTTYVARHCWASIAKSHDVPLSVISEAMGHDSETTTRIYLASLDTSPVDEANRQVILSV